jgi:hypothetical protein
VLSADKRIENVSNVLKRDDIYEYESDGKFRYCLGSDVRTIEQALKLQEQLRTSGYPNASVVAFNNKTPISLEQAKKLQSGQN